MWMFYAISSLLAFLICSVLSGFLYFYNRNSMLYRKFLILSFFIGMWSLCPFAVSYSVNQEAALFSGRFLYIFAIFTPPFLFGFICSVLGINLTITYKKRFILLFFIAFCFLAFSYSDLFIKGFVSKAPNVYAVPGFLYYLFLIYFFSLCVYVSIVVHKRYKSFQSLYEKERLKFLSISFAVLYIAGLMHLLEPIFHVEYVPHDLLVIVWFFIVLYTVSKYRYLNIKLALVNTLIFVTIYVIILIVPIAIGIITRKWIISAFSLLVLSSLGPVIFNYIQKRSENFLLSEQIKYQQFLIWASRVIAKQQNINKLSSLVVKIIKKRVKINFVSFFIFNEKEDGFVKTAGDLKRKKEVIKRHDYFKAVSYMQKEKTPFVVFNLLPEIKDVFSKINNGIHLVIPVMLREQLIAFLLLGDKVNKSIYSTSDIEIFSTISNQISLAISNANFIEQIKLQQEKIFEIRKLASIGGMAGGMAHQIKNRLHQFSMASGLMDVEIESFLSDHKIENKQCENFVNTMKDIAFSISSNVHYTNDVIQNILNFARKTEQDSSFSKFSFKEAFERAHQLLKVKHQKDEIPIEMDIPANDMIYGSKSQIQEVLFNCLDNAYEAVEEKRLKLYQKTKQHETNSKSDIKVVLKHSKEGAVISIIDNGIGIKQENRSKIFSPFFTTKELNNSGTGIGSYVIKRMIEENHRGKISFKSEYGVGTTFTIVLPEEFNER